MSELHERNYVDVPRTMSRRTKVWMLTGILLALIIAFSAWAIVENQFVSDMQNNSYLTVSTDFDTAIRIDSGSAFDLDGDGKDDVIEYNDDITYLTINGRKYETGVEYSIAPHEYSVYVGNVSKNDSFLEIFICFKNQNNYKDNWLYVYRFDAATLDRFRFTYTLPDYASASDKAIKITEDVRVWIPGEPIMLFGDGRISWRDFYNEGSYVYPVYQLENSMVFVEQSPIIKTTPLF